MMRTLGLVVILATTLLGGAGLATAQTAPTSGWQLQNPTFPLVPLQAVTCPSMDICLAAGLDTVFTTQDGGATWRHKRVDKGSQINQIVCVSTSSCFLLAEQIQGGKGAGVVFRTQDGGKTWTSVAGLPQAFLVGASCPTTSVCYLMGGQAGLADPNSPVFMFRSDDAGAHWTQLHGQSLYSVSLPSLACISLTQCYLGGVESILVTKNGGQTWSKRSLPGANTDPYARWGVNNISCPASNRCYAVMGNGAIYGTQDGWNTSRLLRAATSTGRGNPPIQRISCPAPAACYATSYSATLLATTNGGASWKSINTGSSNGIQALACITSSACTAVGENTTIVITRDGGLTWRAGYPGTTNWLTAIACPDAATCTAVGAAGTALSSSDSGKVWKIDRSGVRESLDAVSCPTTTVCYAVGGSRYASPAAGAVALTAGAVIVRTSDGGTSWSVLARNPIGGRPLDLAGVACPSADVCYATSDSGAILATADGGRTWRWGRTGAYFELRGIACPTTVHCLAVGGLDAECNSFVRRGDSAPARPSFDGCDTPEVGVIFATDDGGHTWQRRYYRQVDMNRPPITAAHLYSISCPSQTTCFAAGHNIVVKSVDGGQTWRLATKNPILQSSPNQFGSQVALSLTCPSVTTCWASLGVPTLARTDDGGVTWTAVPAHPKPRAGFVSAVTCPTLATCYAVGGAGLIMRLGPGGSAHVTRMRAFRTLHRDSAAGSTG